MSHLLFADDTLVFYENSQEQMTYLSWILIWFKALLVLRIKLDKSELISIGKVTDVDSLTTELGCKGEETSLHLSRITFGSFLWIRSSMGCNITVLFRSSLYIFLGNITLYITVLLGGRKRNLILCLTFCIMSHFAFLNYQLCSMDNLNEELVCVGYQIIAPKL